jgi:hypothetical protein
VRRQLSADLVRTGSRAWYGGSIRQGSSCSGRRAILRSITLHYVINIMNYFSESPVQQTRNPRRTQRQKSQPHLRPFDSSSSCYLMHHPVPVITNTVVASEHGRSTAGNVFLVSHCSHEWQFEHCISNGKSSSDRIPAKRSESDTAAPWLERRMRLFPRGLAYPKGVYRVS